MSQFFIKDSVLKETVAEDEAEEAVFVLRWVALELVTHTMWLSIVSNLTDIAREVEGGLIELLEDLDLEGISLRVYLADFAFELLGSFFLQDILSSILEVLELGELKTLEALSQLILEC